MNRKDLIRALIDDIDRTPFQAQFKKKPHLSPVMGWKARLGRYFWPNPEFGYETNVKKLGPLLVAGERLALAPLPWSSSVKDQALAFASQVFEWGRVRQKEVTPELVSSVLNAALTRTSNGAPMNSGWTKVAAFVTAHLEDENRSQAICDSRVAWSLVRRMDAILSNASVTKVPDWLRYVGKIPGRGGTRLIMSTNLKWPNAYRNWNSHFAISDLIRGIRDELNRRNVPVVRSADGKAVWTVRTVEMALFMDGY